MIPTAFSPWAWAVAAAVIAFLELPVPGSYLIWIACAAALTALVSFVIDLSLTGQLTCFVVACGVSCFAGHFVYRHLALCGSDTEPMNRRDLDLVGASCVAAETFANGHGRIRLGDSIWLAECTEDVAAGTPVVVTAVRGTSLVVARKSAAV